MKQINYESTLKNTDKFRGSIIGDGNYGHNYKLLYKNFIKDNIKILEIGTLTGGFSKFMKDNNIVSSLLVGADLHFLNVPQNSLEDKTNYNNLYDDFFTGNAYSQQFLEWNKNKNYSYDLIIEDGDHHLESQKFIIKNLETLLSDGGIFICEDIENYSNANILMDFVPQKFKKYSYIWDGSKSIGRSDDICLIIDMS